MGKKSRRARSDQPARVKRKPVPFVERPFDGLSAEADLVAMREILPAATITATTTADHGSRTVTFVTLLPQIWAALARDDGEILVALQTNERSGDASRDAAAALLAALDAEPGTEIASVGLLEPGPRLQDVLEPDSFGEIELSEGFDFWLAPDAERTDEVAAALEQSGEGVVPTEAVDEFKRIMVDIQRSGHYSFLNVFKLFGPGNQAPLSFPIPGWNVCVDFQIKAGLSEFLTELDRRVLEFGGRLYTAKDSRTTAQAFHAMYPRIEEWLAVRRKVDPDGVFVSDMARRLELV